MKPIKIYPEGSYIQGIDFSSEIQYNMFVDVIPQGVNSDEVNIIFLSEPDAISGLIKHLPVCHKMFDYILTHNQDVLNNYENSRLLNFNSIWATNKDYGQKEFTISNIVGNKMWTPQQIMRQELWFMQEQIPNRRFYASSFGMPKNTFGNPLMGKNKDDLFKSQFHIAIENCSVNHYFSEKILDCFISKTIPIYCGCLNIGEYFNEKGILKFTNTKECIDICKSLTKETYNQMLPYVEENYIKSLEYIDWQKRIRDVISQLEMKKSLH